MTSEVGENPACARQWGLSSESLHSAEHGDLADRSLRTGKGPV